MPRNFIPSDPDPFGIYPDPLGKAREAALSSALTDAALAGDMPASRLFSNLSVALERDIWQEVRREREELRENSPF